MMFFTESAATAENDIKDSLISPRFVIDKSISPLLYLRL